MEIPREHWKETARVVEEALYGTTKQPRLFEPERPAELEQWADRIVRRVEREGKWKPVKRLPSARRSSPEPIGDKADTRAENDKKGVADGVVVSEVGHTHTTGLGPVLVGLHAWNRLGMPELLADLGFSEQQRRTAAALVLNRLDDPVSEHAMPAWIANGSLPDLLGGELRARADDAFYRVGDRLLERRDRIEAHLRRRQAGLFQLNRTLLLYDLTNTHFEGACAANPKAKRGRNKQKRHDCPQVVIGMVFDEFGFELAHRTFQGNMSDSKSLLEMLDQLRAAGGSLDLAAGKRPLVIMDGGVATAANRALLREHGFDYLVNESRPSRSKWRDRFAAGGFKTVSGRDPMQSVEVRAEEVEVQTTGEETLRETLIFCRSAGRRQKEAAIRSRAEDRFLRDLEHLQQRIESGRLKEKEKIDRAVGRVLAKHPRVARYYRVQPARSDLGAPTLRWTRNRDKWAAAEELDGCYVLRTTVKDIRPEEYWNLYMTLCRAENGFRMLKGDLGLRPNYHQLEERVDAHIFITVLAYHLLRFIEYGLSRTGDMRSWPTLRRVLQTHCYTTILLPTADGTLHRLRRPGEPGPEQRRIYEALRVDWRNLPKSTVVVPGKKQPETL